MSHMDGSIDKVPVILETKTTRERLEAFPWWLVVIVLALIFMAVQIAINPDYAKAFGAIIPGIYITVYITIIGFIGGLIIGLLAGLGRISHNVVLRNVSIAYIEFVRGVPILVLIFTVAFVFVPLLTDLVAGFNLTPETQTSITSWTSLEFDNKGGIRISQDVRTIIALSVIYGAYMAEVFRAGVESIPKGQMEAARSLGMTHTQAMIYIILPQAVRNMLPALGNDFIAMLKDSSLASVLAVREITQQARLYVGSTFRFRESYLVLTFLYLVMTIILSLFLQWYQRRLSDDG